MKFNPKSLKSFFNFIRQSPIDDMAVNAVKNNADDMAMGALNVVDDIPTSISFDDITDAHMWRQSHDINKPPITPAEFKKQFNAGLPARQETRDLLKQFPDMENTAPSDLDLLLHNDAILNQNPPEIFELDNSPDYDALDINPVYYGQNPDLIDSLEYPDGFKTPNGFAHYYDDLELGVQTSPRAIVNGRDIQYTASPSDDLIIDGKRYHYPENVADMNSAGMDYDEMLRVLPAQDMLKADIMGNLGYKAHATRHGIKDLMPYSDGAIPAEHLVGEYTGIWRPHKNTALGKFFSKHGRLPNGLALPKPWDLQYDW